MDRKARLRKKWADKPEHYKNRFNLDGWDRTRSPLLFPPRKRTQREHQESGCKDYLQHSADSCPLLKIGKSAFPELTRQENETIDRARLAGFALYFPAFPNAQTQALSTLRAAKKFLWEKDHSKTNQ